MKIFQTLTNKEYWIHIAVIVISILLFQTPVSNFILGYIELNLIIVSFLSISFILVISDLFLHKILELE